MERIKVLIVHGASSGLGDWIRISRIIKYLKDSGYDVSEACLPTVTLRHLTKGGITKLIKYLVPFRKFAKHRSGSKVYQDISLSVRWNYLRAILKSRSYDVVVSETSMVGWLVSKVLRYIGKEIPHIIDVHGLSSAEAKGVGDQYWIIREAMEREAFEKSTYLFVVSESMKQFISGHFGISINKMILVRNGGDPQELRAEFGEPLKVIYAGAFSYWEQVDDFLDIAKHASESKFKFYLAGAGPQKKHLLSRIHKEKIPVTYLGHIPRADMFRIMSKMQIGIAPSSKDTTRKVAAPIKVLDYLSCGLPIICPCFGDWGKMIRDLNCGYALENDSLETYLEALDKLSISEIWQQKSDSGFNAILEGYTWNHILAPVGILIRNIDSTLR